MQGHIKINYIFIYQQQNIRKQNLKKLYHLHEKNINACKLPHARYAIPLHIKLYKIIEIYQIRPS